jgi:ABC-type multidrug transport system ATPase subunit
MSDDTARGSDRTATGSDDAAPTVVVSDLVVTCGDHRALDGVSLSVRPGRLHCLVGPNGSGKTTLFRTLAGLDRPDAGHVAVDGTPGFGFQSPNCFDSLTVAENLATFADILGVDDERERLLTDFGLDRVADRRAGALSDGFRTRLDTAVALLGDPDVVVLDEPLADLDAAAERAVLSVLDRHTDAGTTVLVATHRVESFESVVDGATVLDRGSVVARVEGEALVDTYLDAVTDP